jgi:uncharacterized protein (TIGR02611 family)
MTSRGHDMLVRLRERQTRHRERTVLFRIVFALTGFVVVLGGILLLVLPGPGLLVMAIGLGMLALEFAWAERALERALLRVDREVGRIQRRRARRRAATDAEEEATPP